MQGVVADKQCTCPASRPMWERYPPTPPAFALRYASGFGSASQSPFPGEGCRAGASAEAGMCSLNPFHCGENEIQARLITSASVGASPAALTI